MKDLIPRVWLGRETGHCGMCHDAGAQSVEEYPIPKRWSEWDHKIARDDDTQSDVSNEPSQIWENTRRMNSWPRSSVSLNLTQGALAFYRVEDNLYKCHRQSTN